MNSKSILVALAAMTMIAVPVTADAPGNDDRANARVIDQFPYADASTTVGATLEPGEPDEVLWCPGWLEELGASVWYQVSPLLPLTIRIDSNGSQITPLLAVFTDGAQGLERVGCQELVYPPGGGVYTAIEFDPAVGETYWIQVAAGIGQTGVTPGPYRLNVNQDLLEVIANGLADATEAVGDCEAAIGAGNPLECVPADIGPTPLDRCRDYIGAGRPIDCIPDALMPPTVQSCVDGVDNGDLSGCPVLGGLPDPEDCLGGVLQAPDRCVPRAVNECLLHVLAGRPERCLGGGITNP